MCLLMLISTQVFSQPTATKIKFKDPVQHTWQQDWLAAVNAWHTAGNAYELGQDTTGLVAAAKNAIITLLSRPDYQTQIKSIADGGAKGCQKKFVLWLEIYGMPSYWTAWIDYCMCMAALGLHVPFPWEWQY